MNDQNNKKTLILFYPDYWELRAFYISTAKLVMGNL
jgi:hypothetical protein